MADEQDGKLDTHRLAGFIFVRELHEVFLLLDHISGRWDKDLDAIAGDTPLSIIRQMCEIGLAPDKDSEHSVEHAVALLDAKDKLNAVARPATGLTIAFTLLVVGEENRRGVVSTVRRMVRKLVLGDGEAERGAPDRQRDANGMLWDQPTRMTLARYAFPGLICVAESFKRRVVTLVVFLLTTLVATCMLSWHVTAGNVMLEHLEAVKVQRVKLQAEIAAAELHQTAEERTRLAGAGGVPGGMVLVSFCAAPDAAGKTAYRSTEEYQLCTRQTALREEGQAIRRNLRDWLAPWRSVYSLFDQSRQDGAEDKLSAEDKSRAVDAERVRRRGTEDLSRIVSQVVGTAVLPLLYGVLGAGAAVVRRLWERMRESMLSPRDSTMALLQLALGATVGACIALFISPSSPGAADEPNLIGSWGLSSSALSFIAGFGVEGVFRALESFIQRVFNITDPAHKP